LVERTLTVLEGPIPFQTDDPIAELQAVTDERANGVAGLVLAELKRRLEAISAEGAAGWADKGARIDEVVVDGAGAVGATDLPARPLGLLLLLRRRRRSLCRGPSPSRCRRSFVRESRLQGSDRAKHADRGKKQFSHDTPP